MKKIVAALLLAVLFSTALSAKANTKVEQVVKSSFKNVSAVEPKRLILTKEEYRKVQARAKAKVTTKVYRYYVVKSGSRTVGYGVLISRKVRTKMASVLYGFTPSGIMKFAEIMAFGEPPEYIPNDTWMGQFKEKGKSAALKMGKDIPTISGATLSARNVSDGARIARALLETAIRK